MVSEFDPYHKWLGIPPEEQPPNHYRLLGIRLFEHDPDVIESAADQRMVHLRNHDSGEHSAESQELLNEVAAARVCLLDPARRAEYDEQLRREAGPGSPASGVSSQTSPPVTPPPPIATAVKPEPFVPARAADRGRPNWRLPAAIGAATLIIAVALWARFSGNEPDELTQQPGESPSAQRAEDGPLSSSQRTEPTAGQPAETQTAPEPASSAESEPPQEPSSQPNLSPGPATEAEPAAQEAEPEVQTQPLPEVDSATEPSKRLDVPSSDVQAEITRQLDEIYGLGQIRTPAKKIELARQLFDLASKSSNPNEQFAIMRHVMDLACQGGDAALMIEAIAAVAEKFDVKVEKVRDHFLNQFASQATDKAAIKSYIDGTRSMVEEACAAEQYDVALKIAKTAYVLTMRSGGHTYRKEMYERRKEIQELHDAWLPLQEARDRLEANANDADAHLALGRYLCFTKGDWQSGLPHLARGADEALRVLAERDLQSPEKSGDQLALADAWWGLTAEQDNTAAAACRGRAAVWYRHTLPQLSGLSKAKAEQRLKEFTAAGRTVPTDRVGTSSPRQLSPEEHLRLFTEALRQAKPVKLGPTVNSDSKEEHPALSADGCTLLFASDRPGGLGKYDLWMCVRSSLNEPFGRPVNLGPPINSSHWESCPALSADGRLLLFNSDRPGGFGKGDLWMCRRPGAGKPFGVPVNLGPTVNSSESEAGPTLAPDERTLLFHSSRRGGLGMDDLWMCERASSKKPFGRPVNLGPTINSQARDSHPALSSDGRILLFSSSRPGGLGGWDLWMCMRTSLNEPFGPPVNLGPNINSSSNELSPALSADGRLLVFSGHDLWMVKLELPADASQDTAVKHRTHRDSASPAKTVRRADFRAFYWRYDNGPMVLLPLEKMTVRTHEKALYVRNTIGARHFAGFFYEPTVFDGDFRLGVEVRGDMMSIGLQDMSRGGSAVLRPPADKSWHTFAMQRKRGVLTISWDGAAVTPTYNGAASDIMGKFRILLKSGKECGIRKFAYEKK